METINRSIDINVPLTEAYNQWTQFEQFPRFVPALEEVRQLDDRHLYWRARVDGTGVEWSSEITRQIPDEVIAWHSTDGPRHSAQVEFEPLSVNQTRVNLQLSYEPVSAPAPDVNGPRILLDGLQKQLQNFKLFMERRGHATGAWRGRIFGERESSRA